jgi:hypothetical protein
MITMISKSNPPPIYMVDTPPLARIPQESRQTTPSRDPIASGSSNSWVRDRVSIGS